MKRLRYQERWMGRSLYLSKASKNDIQEEGRAFLNSETSSSPFAPSTATTTSNIKKVASIQKYSRLPVWPAWNGALLFLLSKILPNSIIANLEDKIGGRVCPNFFQGEATSPFIMLVHHVHSFASFDFLRYFQKQVILPEGFPAHPHRGFITLTYCIKGGMRHRDSLGCLQNYGAEARHSGYTAQWLVAGAGMLHEEMWDIDHNSDGIISQQELFQLWINLPSKYKLTNPRLTLLRNTSSDGVQAGLDDEQRQYDAQEESDSIEIPIVAKNGSKTLVLVGEYEGTCSRLETCSPMSILHVRMEPNSVWSMICPNSFKTGLIYMRTGSALMLSESSNNDELVEAHYTATLTPYGENIQIRSQENGADFMMLLGEPLYEPVQARGSMVMNTWDEIDTAYEDYAKGMMGKPWNHDLTNEEWERHVKKAPSRYM